MGGLSSLIRGLRQALRGGLHPLAGPLEGVIQRSGAVDELRAEAEAEYAQGLALNETATALGGVQGLAMAIAIDLAIPGPGGESRVAGEVAQQADEVADALARAGDDVAEAGSDALARVGDVLVRGSDEVSSKAGAAGGERARKAFTPGSKSKIEPFVKSRPPMLGVNLYACVCMDLHGVQATPYNAKTPRRQGAKRLTKGRQLIGLWGCDIMNIELNSQGEVGRLRQRPEEAMPTQYLTFLARHLRVHQHNRGVLASWRLGVLALKNIKVNPETSWHLESAGRRVVGYAGAMMHAGDE